MMSRKLFVAMLMFAFLCTPAFAHIFSNTFVEFHMDFGKSKEHFDGLHSAGIFTMTLEHYSAHAYGDNFFFIDVCSSRNFEFGTNEGSIYMEYAPRFSINRIAGMGKWEGFLSEVYLTPQINYGYASARWHFTGDEKGSQLAHFSLGPIFLLGLSVDLNVPGIQVLNMSFLYRYHVRENQDNDPILGDGRMHDDSGFQFTLVWGAKLAKLFDTTPPAVEGKEKPEPSKAGEVWFRGFLDVWFPGELTDDRGTLLTEPQLLVYLTNQLAIGTEVEMSYNFAGTAEGTQHFEVDPTVFLRFDF